MERAKALIGQKSNLVCQDYSKTAFQCSWRKWWRLDSHQRRDLDRASTSEAVGGGELYRFGSFNSCSQNRIRGIAAKKQSIRVIMNAWIAMTNTVFGP